MKLEVLGQTLDKEQTKAALYHKKNSIIIAGAGSGKSLTMIGKIKYLVLYQNIKIEDILCITFTNNAAKSLEDKLKKELNFKTNVYTFHKLALKILNDYQINYSIASDDLLEYLVDEIMYAIYPEPYFEKLFLNKNYLSSKEFINYKKLIIRFLHLFIANYYDIKKFDKIISLASKKDVPFLTIIKKIYSMYLLEKKSSGIIDFDDMIYIATDLVRQKGIKNTYRYIIIDEYQDTSKIRENLIKEIQNKTKAIITVVGDDFQSIYRFSGCDINQFISFPKHFSPAKILYLTNTYRNSQELIKVAGSFVMKNPYQIKKNLKSNKRISKPIILCYYKDIKKDFLKVLSMVPSNHIMILGRNNLDIYSYLSSSISMLNNEFVFHSKKIYYKTIHKAKGLEEENVVIINLTNDIYSLPTKIKDEKILKYVLPRKNIFPFDEERRLFYVALTRTKNYCYLFVPKDNPSIFIEELLKDYKDYITIHYL